MLSSVVSPVHHSQVCRGKRIVSLHLNFFNCLCGAFLLSILSVAEIGTYNSLSVYQKVFNLNLVIHKGQEFFYLRVSTKCLTHHRPSVRTRELYQLLCFMVCGDLQISLPSLCLSPCSPSFSPTFNLLPARPPNTNPYFQSFIPTPQTSEHVHHTSPTKKSPSPSPPHPPLYMSLSPSSFSFPQTRKGLILQKLQPCASVSPPATPKRSSLKTFI